MSGFTPGPYGVRVECVSVGLHRNGYAHQVRIGPVWHTVAHSEQANYQRVETTQTGRLVVQKGIGPIEPDMTPHPDAILLHAAPDLLAACEGLVVEASSMLTEARTRLGGHVGSGVERKINAARAAIAKARQA